MQNTSSNSSFSTILSSISFSYSIIWAVIYYSIIKTCYGLVENSWWTGINMKLTQELINELSNSFLNIMNKFSSQVYSYYVICWVILSIVLLFISLLYYKKGNSLTVKNIVPLIIANIFSIFLLIIFYL